MYVVKLVTGKESIANEFSSLDMYNYSSINQPTKPNNAIWGKQASKMYLFEKKTCFFIFYFFVQKASVEPSPLKQRFTEGIELSSSCIGNHKIADYEIFAYEKGIKFTYKPRPYWIGRGLILMVKICI
jgi:hypothetical protein